MHNVRQPRKPTYRAERLEISNKRVRDRAVSRTDGQPVAPRDKKSGEIAKPLARKRVRSTSGGIQPREACEDERQRHRPRRRHNPSKKTEAAVRRERGGQKQNARPDHVAHDQRDGNPKTDLARDGHERSRIVTLVPSARAWCLVGYSSQ